MRNYTRLIVTFSLAVFVIAANVARADDKDSKAVSDSANKLDLSTPGSQLKFYGDFTVGYEKTFGKSACAKQDGMFSQLRVGTDFKLAPNITMAIQLVAGQYSNGLPVH